MTVLLTINFSANYFLIYPRSCKCNHGSTTKSSDAQPRDKFKRDSGSLRGQGWKYGSGFVDGIFPMLSPDAQEILNFMKKETNVNKVWDALSSLPPTHTTWDDIISVAV
uniref:Uncharacterized protein n=1 Tax=Lactuca sativa TaxID=4236 RepID=A0A9R1W6A9_LACSA|nr:hypothetical protein LSAT_V11C300149560 [Lactuca sativa]